MTAGRGLSRRSFLIGSAGAAAAAAFQPWRLPMAGARTLLPPPRGGAPFDHIVLLMMGNRTFDHPLGWLPGADGPQAGGAFTRPRRPRYPPHQPPPGLHGCSLKD